MSNESGTLNDPDLVRRKRRLWPWIIAAIAVVVVAGLIVFFALQSRSTSDDTAAAGEDAAGTLTAIIATDGQPDVQLLIEFVSEELGPEYGLQLEEQIIGDNLQLNQAISDGAAQGTLAQHEPWLSLVVDSNPDVRIESAGAVFHWAFSLWSDSYESLEALPEGATIGLYSDPANEGLSLWLLAEAGLIELDPEVVPWEATRSDIVANDRKFEFQLFEIGSDARIYPDVDAVVGYNKYFLAADIPIEKAIFTAPAPDELAGILTIGTDAKDTEVVKRLVAAFSDPAVQEFLANDETAKQYLFPLGQ